MQVSFLVRGEDARKRVEGAVFPEGVNQRVGTYHAEGGDLYYIALEVEGKSLASARVLARSRDAVHSKSDTRILRDDASSKFGELLYPGICEFERGIRAAFTIAACSDYGQFDDQWVTDLESKDLGEFKDYLLHDAVFLKDVRSIAQSKTKDELLASIEAIEEHSVWNKLFGEKTMRSVKCNFKPIVRLRHDVMHFHTITEDVFDFGRRMLKRANREIQDYLADSQHDVDYPKRKAPDAREAIAKMNESYANMLAESSRKILEVLNSSGALDSVRGVVDVLGASITTESLNRLMKLQAISFTPQMRGIQEQVSRTFNTPEMKEMLERVASISVEPFANPPIQNPENLKEPHHNECFSRDGDEQLNDPVDACEDDGWSEEEG